MTHNYHLIGIGGIGMSGIAQLLLRLGFKVSGSDLKEGPITRELEKLGARICIGHDARNLPDAEVIVYSSAIKEDNPEVIEARRRGIPLIKRAEALAGLMREKTVITVAGSHGKTTTTSLISCLLLEAGLSPTLAIGGILKNIDTNACCGKGEFFVAEADESDGSFLYYSPVYSVITNIDREHLDYYKDFGLEIEAFRQFIMRTREDGCVFACADDANLVRLLEGYKGNFLLFGLKESAHIYPGKIKFNGLSSEFDCFYRGEFLARFRLALGGEHNISNALSVIALGLHLGIKIEVIQRALINYKGAARRLETKFEGREILLLDDYAHHPTEIKATLEAVGKLGSKRVVAVFQPHRYSRTKLLMQDFASSFGAVDCLMVTDIYAASEPPLEGVNAQALCAAIKNHSSQKAVEYVPKEKIIERLLDEARPGDLLITLGAGDITRICDELAGKLKSQS
jgi:UDP-N-acetylmuramate--alanine ligase